MTEKKGPAWLHECLGMLAVIAALICLFAALSEHFLKVSTWMAMANQIPALMVMAVGMTFVLVIAGIDLSVGSVLALSGAVLGIALSQWEWPLWSAILLACMTGTLVGLVNGLISVTWRVPSFIVTLGMLEIARGLAYLVTDSQTQYLGSQVEVIGSPLSDVVAADSLWSGFDFSLAFLCALIVVFLGQALLTKTVFGRHMIAIGTNEEVVRLNGIQTGPIKCLVFTIAGFCAGLAGVFQIGYLASADPNAGIGWELSAIAAVVIGGTSLMGGQGSVIRSFFGVIIIVILQTGLAQIGASEAMKRVITGAVIVLAVIADVYRNRLNSRRKA